ncbi:hypothetical protein [Cryptosporangium minutisporangium]|uniref:Uncharacterized protein n=1 Tax=Cryptosporangium minutisporangium TaxID=113569 RepID=A0ABP6SZX6_9ACTN
MTEAHVSLDAASLSPAVERLRGPLEEQLTSALQNAIETVGAAYAGQDVEQVVAELVTQTKMGLHPDIAAGFAPDHDELRSVALAIVRERG